MVHASKKIEFCSFIMPVFFKVYSPSIKSTSFFLSSFRLFLRVQSPKVSGPDKKASIDWRTMIKSWFSNHHGSVGPIRHIHTYYYNYGSIKLDDQWVHADYCLSLQTHPDGWRFRAKMITLYYSGPDKYKFDIRNNNWFSCCQTEWGKLSELFLFSLFTVCRDVRVVTRELHFDWHSLRLTEVVLFRGKIKKQGSKY